MSRTPPKDKANHRHRVVLLDQHAAQFEQGDLKSYPPLEVFGLTPNSVDLIYSQLESYQARHAIFGVLATVSAVASLVGAMAMAVTHSESFLAFLLTVILVGSIGIAAHSFPLSHSTAHYWKRHPDDFEVLRFYEQWHHLRCRFLAKVATLQAEQAHREAIQEQQAAADAAQTERVEQSMISIDKQFQDSYAAREERLKLVPVHPIRNARQLSELLAGIDDDIKAAFARLSPSSLCALMIDYEAAYGIAARQYAERTWQQWSLGEIKMSAQVAQRLLSLVPKFMSLEERFELVKKLREKYRAERIHRRVECRSDELRQSVEPVVTELVDRSNIVSFPQSLVDRIEWILDADVAAAHKLLSAVETEEAERRVAYLESEFRNIEELIRRMSGRGTFIHRIDLPQGSITIAVSRPRRDFLKLAKRVVS